MIGNRPLFSLTAHACTAFLVFSPLAFGQAPTGEQPLFASHSVMDVRIEAPLKTLMRERPDEEYLEGTFSYTADDGSERTFDLKLRTRGKFRRQKSTCQFAPIRLNFRTKQVEGSAFHGQDKLKLVTHCNTRRDRYEQLVLREFLTYRILHVLTDKNFGARLMRINYIDTEGSKPFTRYGFVIEDEDDIGARLGLTKSSASTLSYADLDAAHTSLITIYEYLIGNTDFSLIRGPEEGDCCHNAVPFSDGATVYSIPYDFDHAGMVNAPYAKPNPQFKIRTVRSRVYRGRCSQNGILPDTLGYFVSKKDEITGLVRNLEGLDEKNRKQVADYVDKFFEDIADADEIEKNFIRKCS